MSCASRFGSVFLEEYDDNYELTSSGMYQGKIKRMEVAQICKWLKSTRDAVQEVQEV